MTTKILLTGGAGFIGSFLSEKLIENGHEVICLDNFDDYYQRVIKENNLKVSLKSKLFTLIQGDIRDRTLLDTIFKEHKIDLVVHLAAKAGVRPSIVNANEYFDVNVNGTLNLLEVMKTHAVKKLVFASSSSIYGNNSKTPYSETDPVDNPISPYAASKKSGELLTHTYHHLFNLNVINLRFFTAFGPRQRPDLAIHKFFKRLYVNQPIEVYGDGTTSRDYTYVLDIVAGIINAIEYLENHNSVYEIINLGNNTPVKLSHLIDLIEEVTQKQFIITKMPMQPGDVNTTVADISKAQRMLNYNPSTSLQQGLNEFKKWLML